MWVNIFGSSSYPILSAGSLHGWIKFRFDVENVQVTCQTNIQGTIFHSVQDDPDPRISSLTFPDNETAAECSVSKPITSVEVIRGATTEIPSNEGNEIQLKTYTTKATQGKEGGIVISYRTPANFASSKFHQVSVTFSKYVEVDDSPATNCRLSINGQESDEKLISGQNGKSLSVAFSPSLIKPDTAYSIHCPTFSTKYQRGDYVVAGSLAYFRDFVYNTSAKYVPLTVSGSNSVDESEYPSNDGMLESSATSTHVVLLGTMVLASVAALFF